MPASDVQGPLGPQLVLTATRSPAYAQPEDAKLALPRSRSQPTGESSQGPSSTPRIQSESSLSIPPAMSAPRSPPTADSSAPEQPAPPSPVPTEIITPDLTQEEIVAEIQQAGIKVRDFANDTVAPTDQRAPELFDPILGWHVYELMLENTNPDRSALNARYVRRLLDLGWVSEEIDGHRWLQKDREALVKFDSRPHYPWKALKLPQPERDNLKEVATTRFQWVNAEQLVPQFISRGIPRFATAFRGVRNSFMHYQKRPAINDATETEEDPDVSPRLKKRRLSGAESAAPSYSVMLANRKLPHQSPARPSSETPSRPRPAAPLPTQGALSRSLQRHLSMASVTSQYPSDLSRSDSRTTLTQGAESE